MEILWFALGALSAAAALAGWRRPRTEETDTPAADAAPEPDGEAQAYLRQYLNFLRYDGSERGQRSIDNQT